MNNIAKREYSFKISNLRALAILVVAFGHSIIIFDRNWGYYSATYTSQLLETAKHVINCFQMPLFVFVSGYCFYYSKKRLNKESLSKFISSKAKRLLVPFLIFSILWMIPIRLIAKYPYWSNDSIFIIILKIITGKDSGHLWFCPALFLIIVIASYAEIYLINRKKDGFSKSLAIGIMILLYIVSIVSRGIPSGLFFVNDVMRYTAWFYLGYYMNWQGKENSSAALVELLIAFILLGLSLSRPLTSHSEVKSLIECIGGIFLVMALFYIVPNKGNIVINRLSKDSFGIYLFHSPMLYIVFCYFSYLKPIDMVFINFILLLLVSVVLTETLRKFRLGRIAIGEQ